MAITCPSCQTSLPDAAKFCLNCGTALQTTQGTDDIQHKLTVHAFLDAVRKGDLETVETMLRKDTRLANVRDDTVDHMPALCYATTVQDEDTQHDMLHLLITYGAEVQVTTAKSKRTPLHMAVACAATYDWNGYSTVLLLLQHDADPNAQDAKGNTPLHAAINGDFILVILLCSEGADPTIPNIKGETPLAKAERMVPENREPFPGESKESRQYARNRVNVLEQLRKAAGIEDEKE